MVFSIIIPTYNRKALLNYTLSSLSSQLHGGVVFEIIVIDDHSTDGTVDFVGQHFPQVRIVTNSGKGAPVARNLGLKLATGDYIMYLDSDDIVGENYFRAKQDFLAEHPEIDACYGEYDFFRSDAGFDKADIIFKHKYPLITNTESNKAHLIHIFKGNFIPPLAIIWKRSFLAMIGGHDQSLSINQDVELLARAIFRGVRISGVQDGTKVYVRSHALDQRVGDAGGDGKKWMEILALRKRFLANLAKYQLTDGEYREALSNYSFDRWRQLRRQYSDVADAFLQFAKELYWPVELKGSFLLRLMGKLFGPEAAIKAKYFLQRRD